MSRTVTPSQPAAEEVASEEVIIEFEPVRVHFEKEMRDTVEENPVREECGPEKATGKPEVPPAHALCPPSVHQQHQISRLINV